MKKLLLSISILFAFTALAQQPVTGGQQQFSPAQKLNYAERVIEAFYVDSVNPDRLVEDAIVAMLRNLDPHSSYSNADETRELTTPLQGNFSGVGIQFNLNNDSLYVVQTVAGGPSERVGIRAGDRILSANDTILSGAKRTNADILRILRGPKGTEVNIDVVRRGEPDVIHFRVIRDDIPISSIDAAYMAAPGIGYIRVARFAEETAAEVAEAIERLIPQGMEHLILDLEDNGGGYLNAAYELSSIFLEGGDRVVYTDGPRIDPVYYDVPKGNRPLRGRLVVMVNQNSASASEIVSGAVQDNDRGVIVGRRTFGKGLVQRPIPFPDGSMIRLTVSRYFTPSGRSIQKPYTPGDETDYRLDMLHRYEAGEFMSADSIHFADSLRFTTLRRGRTVYGGGGIMPDRFVPIDTVGYSTYYRDLMAKGLFNRYVISYVDVNRDRLKSLYPSVTSFIEGFEVTPEMIDALVAMGEADGVAPDPEGLATSRTIIEAVLKGLVARDIFDTSAYFQVVNPVLSPIFVEALDIITHPDAYNALLQ